MYLAPAFQFSTQECGAVLTEAEEMREVLEGHRVSCPRLSAALQPLAPHTAAWLSWLWQHAAVATRLQSRIICTKSTAWLLPWSRDWQLGPHWHICLLSLSFLGAWRHERPPSPFLLSLCACACASV